MTPALREWLRALLTREEPPASDLDRIGHYFTSPEMRLAIREKLVMRRPAPLTRPSNVAQNPLDAQNALDGGSCVPPTLDDILTG